MPISAWVNESRCCFDSDAAPGSCAECERRFFGIEMLTGLRSTIAAAHFIYDSIEYLGNVRSSCSSHGKLIKFHGTGRAVRTSLFSHSNAPARAFFYPTVCRYFLPPLLRVVPCSVKSLTHRITIALRWVLIANKDGNQYSALAISVRHIAQRDAPRVKSRESTPRSR